MSTTTRFAPSPTGYLHLGNARQAVINWLLARHGNGEFVLRIDDTDRTRSRPEFEQTIFDDLSWLGLGWDRLERQSERTEAYAAAFEILKNSARVYPCFETTEELEAKREARLKRGLPPVYDGASKRLTAEERQAFEAEGRVPHWRFALVSDDIIFDDLIAGLKRFQRRNLGDPVIKRADGSWIYLFASAVDDIELGISHVVRGQDHLSNTPIQIELNRALDAPQPQFAHLPLILDAAGEKFSKRLGSLSLQHLREQGLDPVAVVQVLAALGTSTAPEASRSVESLIKDFSLANFGNAAARLDVEDIRRITVQRLQSLSAEAISKKLGRTIDGSLWQAVSQNIERLEDIEEWRRILEEPLAPAIEDPDFTRIAAELMPQDLTAYDDWIGGIKNATGRKGKPLFHPLRLALTGRDRGPELRVLLPLIGRERAMRRLQGECA